jgi:hypothetical protein
MGLATLDPPPAAIDPAAPPPWPEPTGSVVAPVPPQKQTALALFGGSVVPVILVGSAALAGNAAMMKVGVAAAVVLIVLGWLKLREANALSPAYRARFERSRRAWARVKASKVKGERHARGVLSHYVLEVELEVWLSSEATHRTAPTATPVATEATVPAAIAPQVVPGAFLAVLYDPLERTALPYTLVTREGAQLAISS